MQELYWQPVTGGNETTCKSGGGHEWLSKLGDGGVGESIGREAMTTGNGRRLPRLDRTGHETATIQSLNRVVRILPDQDAQSLDQTGVIGVCRSTFDHFTFEKEKPYETSQAIARDCRIKSLLSRRKPWHRAFRQVPTI